MSRAWVLGLVLLGGCVDGVTQVAGVGATYSTRCSSIMDTQGAEYTARCTPPSCDARFHSAAVNHVVVAVVPDERVVGYSERICLQDLSQASAMFHPEVK